MKFIDLRSDTVTIPTEKMRKAMFEAEVGDDVFSDDPTVNKLEVFAADLLGKQSALFVTSGTQGNAVSLMSHTRRGDAVIMGKSSHIASHEAGAYAVLSGVVPCFAEENNGLILSSKISELIHDDSEMQIAPTGLICIENALSNGTVAPLSNLKEIYEAAKLHNSPVHLDGARLFNAAVYLNTDVKEITKYCDSVSCCLSKGLCAPVGSVVAGDENFIRKARKWRKMLGGGMRQSGILAAAGIISLTDMTYRLHVDHENAKYLAEGLSKIQGIRTAIKNVQINMVFYRADWDENKRNGLVQYMLENGIKITGYMDGEFRMVTHKDITHEDCEKVIKVMKNYAEIYTL